MADVSTGIGSQNIAQPKPAQAAVLATILKPPVSNASPAQNTTPVQNIPPVQNVLTTQNIPHADNVKVAPKASSNSPWDDDLDPVDTVAKNNPTIIGSLDPKVAQPNTNPTPLKLPESMEEKVGQKIPATNFFGAQKDQPVETPLAPVIAPEIASQPVQQSAPKVSSGFLGKLFRKNATSDKALPKELPIAKTTNSIPNPAEVASVLKPELETKVEKENRNSILKKVLILVPGLIVVFALASLLTEVGLLSIGMENVYGSLGVEQIWGGLSPRTEYALGRSALEMKNHPDFKAEGKISITIDKAIQSDIVTPLLTLTTGQSLARDESINLSEKAVQTAADDYYFTTDGNSNLNNNSNVNGDSSSNADEASNLNINTNYSVSSNNENVNINSQSTESLSGSVSSGTRLVEGVFDLKTGSSSNETLIKLNDSANSSISLVNDGNQLFVKTSGNIDYGSIDKNKWLALNIDQLKDKSLITNLFNLNVDSGFSVKGARVGNEKVDNMRCYKYRIDSLEIGSSLAGIGITSDMLPTLSGDVWIGIKDKLIHRLSIKITTPVSSAVRMVNLDASFSDFDVKNSITKVSSSEQTVKQNLSNDDKRKLDVNDLLAALKKYKDDNKSYPVSTSLLKLNSADNIIAKALIPRYLASLPDDPTVASTGWYYAYKSADGTKCSISSRLENQSDKDGSLVNNVLLYLKYSSD